MKEELKYIFSNINDWLKYSEAKHGVIATINIAIIFGIFQLLDKFTAHEISYKKMFIVAICLLLLSILVTFYSFVPITKHKLDCISDEEFSEKKIGMNIMFFGHIHCLREEQLLDLLRSNAGFDEGIKHTIYELNLANQIINNARITSHKFQLFKTAGVLSLSGTLLFVLLAILKYIVELPL